MQAVFKNSLLSLVCALSTINVCFGNNPIVQTNYTADPAPMVHNDTFYVYTGHDEDNANGCFYMTDWRCYSSTKRTIF